MSQDTPALPKFFKDADDFCYIATPALAAQPGMTPWDGAVNMQGFAVDEPKATVKPEAKPAARSRAKAAE